MACRAMLLMAVLVPACAGLSDGPAPEAPGNLLRNGSFETWGEAGPLGWEIVQKGLGERLEQEGAAVHGRVAGSVMCLHPDEFLYLRQSVPMGKPGVYRAWVYVRPVTPIREGRLVVDCLDADGKRLGVESRDLLGQIGEWRRVACDVHPPKGTAVLRYEVRVGPDAIGEVAVDAARLELVREAEGP